jgi:UDP-glucuronate decarboxylase
MNKKSNKILIAGGAGFIGLHLTRTLLKNGNNVVCLDNFSSSRREGLAEFKENSSFEFIEHDVTKPIDLEVSQIYNLASIASPKLYQSKALETLKSNLLGPINLLELAAKNNCRILQASTSEVYGDPLQHPQTESYFGNVDPNGPRACYEEGKRAAETLFTTYHQSLGVDLRLVRLFNCYGPGMLVDDGRVIANFFTQALSGEALTLFGDGKQTRSFCYIDDLTQGLTTIMNNEMPTTPINLGNDQEVTMLHLARRIKELTNSSSRIESRDAAPGDPQQRKPDLTLARKLIDWKPDTSLDAGLTKTMAYFQQELFDIKTAEI